MRGFLHGSKIIFQERGVRGFFQGFVPTTARQAANSATRFTSYTTLKQLAEGYVAPGEKLGTMSTFAIGGVAGLITVYVLGKLPRSHHSTDIKCTQIRHSAPGYGEDKVSTHE
jgi:hypothetical protein